MYCHQRLCSKLLEFVTQATAPQSLAMSSPTSRQAIHPFRQRYQLKDVWNAAVSERDFDHVFWLHVTLDVLVQNGMRYGGYILVLLAGSIIAFLGSGGLLHVLPKIAKLYSFSYFVQYFFGM